MKKSLLVLGVAAILQSALWTVLSPRALIARAFTHTINDWILAQSIRPAAEPLPNRLYLCESTFRQLDAKTIAEHCRALSSLGIQVVCSAEDLSGNCAMDGTTFSYLCLQEELAFPFVGRVEITESYNHMGGDCGYSLEFVYLFGIWIFVWSGDHWVV